MDRLGVFVCTGCDIGAAINLDELKEAVEEGEAPSFKTWETHECLCGKEGVALIQKEIDAEDGVNGVVLAACSERAKVGEFTFDPDKVQTVRVGLREQVAWSQPHGEEDTQMLAGDLVTMGLARADKVELPKKTEEEIDKTVMVVGGGLAGLTAAISANAMGNPVVVVEAADKLGGYLNGMKHVFPEDPPYSELHENPIGALVEEVQKNDQIKVHVGAGFKKIDGQPGQFKVELKSGETFTVGAIIQATGAKPYDASKLEHLGYGKSPKVITSTELEGRMLAGKLDDQEPKRVVFVQCAGSRDEDHLKYCSSECCATTLKQVAEIHGAFPNVETAVIYRDLRAPGQLEHFYLHVQETTKGLFTRGVVEGVDVNESGGGLTVKVKDSLLGEDVAIEADLVVLATGMVPASADGEKIRELWDAHGRVEKKESDTQVEAAQKMIEELKEYDGTEILNLNYRQGPDMPVLSYGFPDSHYICFPYETRRTGIYVAGAVHTPMGPAQAIEDARGAALKAVQAIYASENGAAVHPRSGDIGVADFFLQRCTQCKRCTEECPFGTINEDEKGTPEYNVLRCRRCGICMGACPERIISFPDYSVDAIASMIKAVEVPDEDEEKPRMIAFMCENDAKPALDEAAAKHLSWNPWMRVIPVRCLGAVNTVWIADALSNGWDGVLLLGCKSGDDYQCHYIKGSELCKTRMTNVKETLDRLTLESERVKIEEVARNEYERIPKLFEEFAETIEKVGPNPYKGF